MLAERLERVDLVPEPDFVNLLTIAGTLSRLRGARCQVSMAKRFCLEPVTKPQLATRRVSALGRIPKH